jgi:hypothetical protein
MTDGSKPLLGMRAILVVPTYGPVDPLCSKSVRVAVMVAANRGLEWVGDASSDKMTYSLTRNIAAESLYKGSQGGSEADGIMWIDSDIVANPGDIANLLQSVKSYNEPFVTGIYHQRAGDLLPVIYDYDKRVKGYRQMANYPERAFFPVDGCGFGFCWTGVEVIKKIADLKMFNGEKGLWFPDTRDSKNGYGEDLSFCYMAAQAGFQLYANTAVQVGHLGQPKVIQQEDYLLDVKAKEAKKNEAK